MTMMIIHDRAVRRGQVVLLAAVTIDALYTARYWLILGRDERRNGPYAELKYAAIILQLSVETAAIVYLIGQLRKVREAPEHEAVTA